jgi:hypothetical protein
MEVNLHAFLASALNKGKWSFSPTGCFIAPRGKNALLSIGLYDRLDTVVSWSEQDYKLKI